MNKKTQTNKPKINQTKNQKHTKSIAIQLPKRKLTIDKIIG